MENNDKKNQNAYKDQASFDAIKSLKSISVEPSPYLAKRVLRNLEAQPAAKNSIAAFFSQFKLLPSVSVALATLVITFGVFKLVNKNAAETIQAYALGQAYVIRMDIRPLPNSEIAYAEISLPDENVQFASQKYDIKSQKKLVVSWDSMVEKQYMPIVVQGVKAGSSKVIVNFYDSDRNLVTSKEISLYFKGGS